MVHVLLKPGLENFEHYFTSVWDEYNSAFFVHSLTLPFFGTGLKIDLFQYCGHCWGFQICWHIESSTFTASSFRIWNSSTGIPGEENGNPLQYSCLENPRVRGAWWAAVYGVSQSRTWLKWLSSSSSSGHNTGKGQFSFQPQRKAMPNYAQTTILLHSSHMLVK